ncbi:aminotransferase class IV [uncultured Draconibacterium sp.]|uniref:aminotransferase class IV n=1 Tax=uncultured Draconibacterium sp. TaxID=1573823 RepID=UPI0025FF7EBB|nr:aminotransferase class IV [uncultured Draconibacterium sp.]
MELLETIKCKDGRLFNLPYHQARFNLALTKFFPGAQKPELSELIKIPESCASGLFKCRVVYSEKIKLIEFLPHQYRPVNSIRLVEANNINYSCKYANRNALQQLFSQRGGCDDILMVKQDCITDSFTANPVFFDGIKWWTPDTPLLAGTQRARLLAENKISLCRVTLNNLHRFTKIGLINALQDMSDMPVIPISQLKHQ